MTDRPKPKEFQSYSDAEWVAWCAAQEAGVPLDPNKPYPLPYAVAERTRVGCQMSRMQPWELRWSDGRSRYEWSEVPSVFYVLTFQGEAWSPPEANAWTYKPTCRGVAEWYNVRHLKAIAASDNPNMPVLL